MRARYGKKWSVKASIGLELAVVDDPAGPSVRDRADAFETLLRRVPGALRERRFSFSEDLRYGTDMDERARVVEALFQLHPRWASKDLELRRDEICRSVLEGRIKPGSFRSRYELEIYEVVAAVLRGFDRDYRERTGREEGPEPDQDEALIVTELSPKLVSVARLFLYVQTFIGADVSVAVMDKVIRDLQAEGDLEVDAEKLEEDLEDGLTVGEMQHRYSALALFGAADTSREMAGEALVSSLWFWALLLVDLRDLYWRLEAWEGPAAWEAAKAAADLKTLSEPGLRNRADTASTLAHHARSGEPAPVMEYLQTDPGQQTLADWRAFLSSCSCLIPESVDLASSEPLDLESIDASAKQHGSGHQHGCEVGAFAGAARRILERADSHPEAVPGPIVAQLEQIQPESLFSRSVWGGQNPLDLGPLAG